MSQQGYGAFICYQCLYQVGYSTADWGALVCRDETGK